MSHQSDRIYYKQPIKFLVLKANGICTIGTGNDCFVLVACKYREFYFLVTKGNLTLLFFTRE